MTYVGAIEAGGTKFVCAIGTTCGEVIAKTRIPTTAPNQTLRSAFEFFRSVNEQPAAIGIGSFGPLDLNRASPYYGHITTTPKTGWRMFDISGEIERGLRLPVAIDTDVNAAALGECHLGAALGLRTFVYVTVGTGVGGGAMVEGSLLHGQTHPEMGHMRVPHDWNRDPFPGVCPYHGDCLEGLVCGRALQERWSSSGENLPAEHPAWALQAEYLAAACVNWIFTLSPEKLILGGGLMRPYLFPAIRERVLKLLNGYVDFAGHEIVPPGLGDRAGIVGALLLAARRISS